MKTKFIYIGRGILKSNVDYHTVIYNYSEEDVVEMIKKIFGDTRPSIYKTLDRIDEVGTTVYTTYRYQLGNSDSYIYVETYDIMNNKCKLEKHFELLELTEKTIRTIYNGKALKLIK